MPLACARTPLALAVLSLALLAAPAGAEITQVAGQDPIDLETASAPEIADWLEALLDAQGQVAMTLTDWDAVLSRWIDYVDLNGATLEYSTTFDGVEGEDYADLREEIVQIPLATLDHLDVTAYTKPVPDFLLETQEYEGPWSIGPALGGSDDYAFDHTHSGRMLYALTIDAADPDDGFVALSTQLDYDDGLPIEDTEEREYAGVEILLFTEEAATAAELALERLITLADSGAILDAPAEESEVAEEDYPYGYDDYYDDDYETAVVDPVASPEFTSDCDALRTHFAASALTFDSIVKGESIISYLVHELGDCDPAVFTHTMRHELSGEMGNLVNLWHSSVAYVDLDPATITVRETTMGAFLGTEVEDGTYKAVQPTEWASDNWERDPALYVVEITTDDGGNWVFSSQEAYEDGELLDSPATPDGNLLELLTWSRAEADAIAELMRALIAAAGG